MARSPRRFSLQELMIVIGIMLIALAIAIPSAVKSRASGNETSAIQGLRTIHSSEQLAFRADKQYAELQALQTRAGMEERLSSGERTGYDFRLKIRADGARWGAVAMPKEYGVSGRRTFVIGQQGLICYLSEKQEGGIDAFLSSHPYFTTFETKALAGWGTLDGGKIGADGVSAGEGGQSGGAEGGGSSGGGCSLTLP